MPLIKKFSIQLYSVRNEIESLGFPVVLNKLSEIGYTGVEFAGTGSISAVEMKFLLQKLGLKPIGAHIGIARLEEALDEELAYHKTLGTAHITVPMAPFGNIEEVKATAERLNALAPRVADAGFEFSYHNHGAEFEREGGQYRIEQLIELSPECRIQLDLFWAARMGCDCAEFIKKHAPRVNMLHIKQMNAENECVDLCDGVLDFKTLIETGLQNGVKECIHEQEAFSGDAFECLSRGYKHIKSL